MRCGHTPTDDNAACRVLILAIEDWFQAKGDLMPRPSRKRHAIRPLFEELESRALPSSTSLWVIQGDQNPANLDDTIVIELDAWTSADCRDLWELLKRRPSLIAQFSAPPSSFGSPLAQ